MDLHAVRGRGCHGPGLRLGCQRHCSTRPPPSPTINREDGGEVNFVSLRVWESVRGRHEPRVVGGKGRSSAEKIKTLEGSRWKSFKWWSSIKFLIDNPTMEAPRRSPRQSPGANHECSGNQGRNQKRGNERVSEERERNRNREGPGYALF